MKTAQRKNAAITRRGLIAGAGGLAFAVQSGSGARVFVASAGASLSDTLPSPDWSALERGPEVVLADVIDGDTVELERGPDVRLVGTQAPKLPLGRAHVEEWPLAPLAKSGLEGIIRQGGQNAQLYFGGRRTDRHNRHLAHVVLEDGTWLQGAMVLAGLARVYTFADNRSLIPDLLIRERVARNLHNNIWGHPYYAVRDATDVSELEGLSNHFELVEGVVRNVADHRERWYLNFGQTWREDFTVTIEREHDDVFEEGGFDLHALQGQAVRVRGWVLQDGGPLIRVDHPEAIERLGSIDRDT